MKGGKWSWLDGRIERNTFHILHPNSSGKSRKMTDKSGGFPETHFLWFEATAHDSRAGIVSIGYTRHEPKSL